jgi:hypothetical protein
VARLAEGLAIPEPQVEHPLNRRQGLMDCLLAYLRQPHLPILDQPGNLTVFHREGVETSLSMAARMQ